MLHKNGTILRHAASLLGLGYNSVGTQGSVWAEINSPGGPGLTHRLMFRSCDWRYCWCVCGTPRLKSAGLAPCQYCGSINHVPERKQGEGEKEYTGLRNCRINIHKYEFRYPRSGFWGHPVSFLNRRRGEGVVFIKNEYLKPSWNQCFIPACHWYLSIHDSVFTWTPQIHVTLCVLSEPKCGNFTWPPVSEYRAQVGLISKHTPISHLCRKMTELLIETRNPTVNSFGEIDLKILTQLFFSYQLL